MTQREKSSIGMLMIVVFSAMLLWALTVTVWPVPVVYADDPEILTITVTSNRETYFYDPGLEPSGGTVYFNSVGGQGAGQVLTVTVTCSGMIAGSTFEGDPAFEDNPLLDTNAPWQVTYTVEAGVGTQSGIVFTVTNTITETDTAIITFTEDNTGPTIISPTLNELSPFLHADGPMLYYGDEAALFWVEGEAQDDGAGPFQATYSDAFESAPPDDDLIPPLYSWEGYYAVAAETDYGDDTITVTVSDQVGNSATKIFTYTRDITSPTIVPTTISETSPYLHADHLTLYYSNRMGSSPQDFEVQGTASDDINGAGFQHVTFPLAFGDQPGNDTNSPWSGSYDVVSSDSGTDNITVTAYDNVGNWSTRVFTYIEDIINPTVVLTDVTDPGYDFGGDELDDDGSNWYDPDKLGAGWYFTSTVTDTLSGPALANAFRDHSTDHMDHSTDPVIDGTGVLTGVFEGVVNDEDGVVTVTLTISDHVGNPASDAVVFNIDNTGPEITSADISEDSDYLYTDTLTIYYGAGMGLSAQRFAVHGQSNDGEGVGLGDVDFSPALGEDPDNQGTLSDWCGEYDVTNHNTDSGTITVTISDLLDNPAYQTFYYFQDTEPPTVVVTCPVIWSEPSWDVSWNSQDPSPDSGVNHYDVQYKVGSDGLWQGWYTNTLLTQDTFGPSSPVPVEDGQTYYFRARAEDNVSNEGPYTNGEDATTYDSDIKKVFLPVVMTAYCGCGPDNYEPNSPCTQAQALIPNQPYESYISCCDVAFGNNGEGGRGYDYFFFETTTTREITIVLDNTSAGKKYDLYLYRDPVCTGHGWEERDIDKVVAKISTSVRPGKYYVLVFSTFGQYSASPYSLRVAYD